MLIISIVSNLKQVTWSFYEKVYSDYSVIRGFLLIRFLEDKMKLILVILLLCSSTLFAYDSITVKDAVRYIESEKGGQILLVKIFSSGCPHCRNVFPKIIKIAEKNPSLKVLALSIDRNDKKLSKFLSKHSSPFTIKKISRTPNDNFSRLISKTGIKIGKSFGVPLMAVFDKKGKYYGQTSSLSKVKRWIKKVKKLQEPLKK